MTKDSYKYRNAYTNSINQNHCNSNKPFSARLRKPTTYQSVVDPANKIVYQIDKDGKIRSWNSVVEISIAFNVSSETVRYYIKNQKIVGGCLFVMLTNYKNSIDYVKLIKFLKFKKK